MCSGFEKKLQARIKEIDERKWRLGFSQASTARAERERLSKERANIEAILEKARG